MTYCYAVTYFIDKVVHDVYNGITLWNVIFHDYFGYMTY